MEDERTVNSKCVILGNTETGKSSFLVSLVENRFLEENRSTFGVSFNQYHFSFESTKISLYFWEVSGHPGFSKLARMYYQTADACIFFYDVTNLESFKSIKSLIDSVISINSKAKLFAVGNKIDLKENREVTFEEAKLFFDKIGIMFCEISCKENFMIKNLAEAVALSLLY